MMREGRDSGGDHVVLAAPAFLLSDYHLFQLTMIVVYAVAVLGSGC